MGRFSKLAAGLGAATLLIVMVGAYALASSSGGTITVCVRHRGGSLYRAKKCAKADRKLSWNVQGPAGPAGAPGAAGPQGNQGQQGVQGPPGMSNYQVITGTPAESSAGGINLDSAYAFCPSGTSPIGGGFSTGGSNNAIYVRADQPVDGNPGGWFVQTTSASTSGYTIVPYAVCATVSS